MFRTIRITLAGCLLTGCLSLSCTPHTPPSPPRSTPEAMRDCPALLGPMRDITLARRADVSLTTEQEQQRRTWKATCGDAHWHAALDDSLKVPTHALTWRDWVLAAVDGFERGINAPVTTCTTIRNARNGRVSYSTTCNTY